MLKLNQIEKETFKFHILFSLFNGILNGGLILQEIILKKKFSSPNIIITIAVMLWPVSNLFSIYWGYYLENIQERKKLFYLAGIFGRLPLVLSIFVKEGFQLLPILFITYFFNAFIIPVQNTIFQRNYTDKKRNLLFGLSISVFSIFTLITSTIIGKILDINEGSFGIINIFCGVSGFISLIFLSKIEINEKKSKKNERFSAFSPVLNMIKEFRNNKDFLQFETAFTIYGMGILLVLAVIPQFLVNKIQLSYTEISFVRVFMLHTIFAIFMPLSAYLNRYIHPIGLTGVSYFLLFLFSTILGFIPYQTLFPMKSLVVFSFFIYAVAMTGVEITWYLGSIYFTRGKDAIVHQSIHVTLTAVRGLLAPPLGLLIMSKINDLAAFLTGSFFFLLSSFVMISLYKKIKRKID